jgi:hypothetical protein
VAAGTWADEGDRPAGPFTPLFRSALSRENLDRLTLQKRILLCVYALGTNTGIKRMAAGDHGETYDDLRYARRRFTYHADRCATIPLEPPRPDP